MNLAAGRIGQLEPAAANAFKPEFRKLNWSRASSSVLPPSASDTCCLSPSSCRRHKSNGVR